MWHHEWGVRQTRFFVWENGCVSSREKAAGNLGSLYPAFAACLGYAYSFENESKLANPYWSTHVRSQHPQQPFTTAANPKVMTRLSSHLPVAVSRSGAVLMVTRIGMMPNCKIFSRQLASAASLATVCATSRRTPTSACLVRSSSACEQQDQRKGTVNAARS